MGFASESRERARPVLPLAGMVDILFLLLIFFMSTYSMREQELMVDVGLPASESAEPGSNEALKVVITADADGRVFLGSRVIELAELEAELKKLAAISTDQPVIFRGDTEIDYGIILRVIDAANKAGLPTVQLAASEAE